MCFSATASFAAGIFLVTTGIFTLRNVRDRSSIAFASTPVLFGIQQLIEGAVWLSMVPGSLIPQSVVTYGFVFFSHIFWPFFAPLSIWLIEKHPLRKKILGGIALVGAFTSLSLLSSVIIGPVSSSIVGESIAYEMPISYPLTTFLLYLFATCAGAMVASSVKIRVFGTAVLAGFLVAHMFYPETLFSVWCFFAATLSVIIYTHTKELQTSQKTQSTT